jgi:preprotein translocase subunit SecE
MAEANDITTNPAAAAEPSTGFSVYKPGQGYYTRMGTIIGAALVSMLGILWLWEYLKRIEISGVNELYVAAAGAIVIGGIITIGVYYLVFMKHSSVDFLIATEGEMKKVNWSTRREIMGSTTAVITTAVILTVFCWAIDIGFFAFFRFIKVLDS